MTRKICAWCKKPQTIFDLVKTWLGVKRISHGICWGCKEKQLAQLEKVNKNVS